MQAFASEAFVRSKNFVNPEALNQAQREAYIPPLCPPLLSLSLSLSFFFSLFLSFLSLPLFLSLSLSLSLSLFLTQSAHEPEPIIKRLTDVQDDHSAIQLGKLAASALETR